MILWIFSFLFSTTLILFGSWVFYLSVMESPRVALFMFVTALYGIMQLYLLWRIHRNRQTASLKYEIVARIGAITFPILWILGSFDYRILSGQELFASVIVAGICFVNWGAIRQAVNRNDWDKIG